LTKSANGQVVFAPTCNIRRKITEFASASSQTPDRLIDCFTSKRLNRSEEFAKIRL